MSKQGQIVQTAAVVPEFGSYETQRQSRAQVGKVGYPAKAQNRMEKVLFRAQKAIATDKNLLMSLSDDVVANALEISSQR